MTKRLLTLVAAGVLGGTLGATAVSAESLPAQNECEAYQRDLKHDLMLLGPHAKVDPEVLLQAEAAERLCMQGEGEAGSATLQDAIGNDLGLPVRDYD